MLLGNPLYVQLACKVGSSFNGLVILTTMLTWSSGYVSMGSMGPMEFQRMVPLNQWNFREGLRNLWILNRLSCKCNKNIMFLFCREFYALWQPAENPWVSKPFSQFPRVLWNPCWCIHWTLHIIVDCRKTIGSKQVPFSEGICGQFCPFFFLLINSRTYMTEPLNDKSMNAECFKTL